MTSMLVDSSAAGQLDASSARAVGGDARQFRTQPCGERAKHGLGVAGTKFRVLGGPLRKALRDVHEFSSAAQLRAHCSAARCIIVAGVVAQLVLAQPDVQLLAREAEPARSL